ncbi:MAG TPA: tetratricopeptide repeat protein, partial [Pseudonocardiaceae bacterium]
LAARVGAARLRAEPAATEAIITRCARLPLALAIVAARAAGNANLPLAALAAELAPPQPDPVHGNAFPPDHQATADDHERPAAEGDHTAGAAEGDDVHDVHDVHDPLAAFETGDPGTDVRAVLSWSYRALDAEAARLFRLLGLHPGPDVTVPAAAALAGAPPSRVRPLLATLTRAHLLAEREPGRFVPHDLLRAYAAWLCAHTEDAAARTAARRRLFDHHLRTAHAADLLIEPYRLAAVVPLPPGLSPVTGLDRAAAGEWLAGERAVLLAVVAAAHATGFDDHAWRLAAALTTFLDRRGHWADLADVQRVALAAAVRRGDVLGEAHAHRGLAIVSTWLGRPAEAHAHYRRDLELYRAMGDPLGEANTCIGISWVLAREERHAEALATTRDALALFRRIGSTAGQAKALNNIGWLHGRLGDHAAALASCRQALALHSRTGDRHGAALTWDSLGYAHHTLGHHDEAAACYRRALALHRALGDRYDEADVLANLGDTLHAAGDLTAAHDAWHAALTIYDSLRHPDATTLRARIAALGR